MRPSLLNLNIKILPKWILLLFLVTYPLIAFLAEKTIDLLAIKALGLVFVGYLVFRIIEIYKTGSKLVIPTYLIFYGLFFTYTFWCALFVNNYFFMRGIKYFYSDPIWLTFIALIVVENVHFSKKTLELAKKGLGITLVLAAVVSVIQISKPLFFINDELFVQGLSIDRMAEYYRNAPEEVIGNISRFFEGYRLSIFSYINELSIGMDTAAILSILVAWKPHNTIHKGVFTLSAIIVSFLSSSRWIMLNVIIAASQIFWASQNKIKNLLYFIVLSTGLAFLAGFIANFMGLDVQQFISDRLMSDSALTRFLAFEVFFEVFPENPVFGTGGLDTEKMIRLLGGRSSQIHVGYLKLFYYFGVFGGILYLLFMATFLRRVWKMAKQSGYWGGFYAILTFFIANLTLFELSLFYFGPLLAIIFANHFYYNKEDDKTVSKMSLEADNTTFN